MQQMQNNPDQFDRLPDELIQSIDETLPDGFTPKEILEKIQADFDEEFSRDDMESQIRTKEDDIQSLEARKQNSIALMQELEPQLKQV